MRILHFSLFIFLLVSCEGQKVIETRIGEKNEAVLKVFPEECSKFYPFNSEMIDLQILKSVVIDILPATDFKQCSKYAHRFQEKMNDTITIGETTWILEIDNKKNKFILKSENKNGAKGIHVLPRRDPLPEVHEYKGSMFAFGEEIIVLLEDWYDTKYIICKYGGKTKMSVEIENTYITHPEPNTNHHNRYLYYSTMTESQMIFTSHMAFADKFVTRILDLNTFEITEYDKIAHGVILDENEESLVGFVTAKKDYKAEKQPVSFEINMINGKKFDFSIEYGNEVCEFLMKDSLLYIGNYHPISTGSSLHCFDMRTGKMKWTADVLQVNAAHSEYWNKVTLSLYKDKLIMQGDEAYGSYLQIFDSETGKRLADFGLLK